jgi:hypothetical protein
MISFDSLSQKTKDILIRYAKPYNKEPSECMYEVFEKEEIIYLVDAINTLPGLISSESCGGHSNEKEKLKRLDSIYFFPFVRFTITDPEEGLKSLAYVIKGAYENNWNVITNNSRSGAREEIFYSFILLPLKALACEKNYQTEVNELPISIPYRNIASSPEDVEKTQKTIISLSKSIIKLYKTVKNVGIDKVRLRV